MAKPDDNEVSSELEPTEPTEADVWDEPVERMAKPDENEVSRELESTEPTSPEVLDKLEEQEAT